MVPSQRISIVVADDDADLRGVTAVHLRDAGMTVWEAADGDQAVDLVREHRPSVLLLDLWMPGKDGLQVLEALRFDPASSRMAVVILTGDGQADGRLLALAFGATCILVKGGPIQAVIETIRTCAGFALQSPFDPELDDDPGLSGAVPAGQEYEPVPEPASHPHGTTRPDQP